MDLRYPKKRPSESQPKSPDYGVATKGEVRKFNISQIYDPRYTMGLFFKLSVL